MAVILKRRDRRALARGQEVIEQKLGDLPAGNSRPVDPDPTVDVSYARIPGGAVSVGAASTKILDRNPRRVYAAIVNDSSQVVYLKFGTGAELSKGIRLNANGGSLELGHGTDCPYIGEVYGIASSSSTVTVIEI